MPSQHDQGDPKCPSAPTSTLAAQVRQMELAAEASGVDDFFLRLEAAGLMMRIDRQLQPEMFRFALVADRA
jgi:hypothetical protein